jgi:hypothetical protein
MPANISIAIIIGSSSSGGSSSGGGFGGGGSSSSGSSLVSLPQCAAVLRILFVSILYVHCRADYISSQRFRMLTLIIYIISYFLTNDNFV